MSSSPLSTTEREQPCVGTCLSKVIAVDRSGVRSRTVFHNTPYMWAVPLMGWGKVMRKRESKLSASMPAFPTPSLPPLGGSLRFPAVDTMQPVSHAPTAKPSRQGRVFPRLPVTLSPASPLRSFSQVSCHSDNTCTQPPASVHHCTPYFRRAGGVSPLLSEPLLDFTSLVLRQTKACLRGATRKVPIHHHQGLCCLGWPQTPSISASQVPCLTLCLGCLECLIHHSVRKLPGGSSFEAKPQWLNTFYLFFMSCCH